ncbi:hypothetical protein niasHS_000211 [Heterodera schachtii]|uniref:DNA2/NAM7 helicase-like C-terminal domain-containing protein n=2 Tax=Heterodera TaxID=34509 RepID=A0ABD2KBD0_HETSC
MQKPIPSNRPNSSVSKTLACGLEKNVVVSGKSGNEPLSVPVLVDRSDPLGLKSVQPDPVPMESVEAGTKEVSEVMEVDEMSGEKGKRDEMGKEKVKSGGMEEEEESEGSESELLGEGGFGDLKLNPSLRAGNKVIEKEDKGKPYLIAQVRGDGVIAARMKLFWDFPELVFVPFSLFDNAQPIEIGDTFRLHKCEWTKSETGWEERGDWLYEVTGRLNYQATATDVSRLRQRLPTRAVGILVDVQRARDRHVKVSLVLAPELSCVMRAYRRHFPAEFTETDIRYRSVVRLQLRQINSPPSVLYSQQFAYVLPSDFGKKRGDELLLHHAYVIAGVEPEPMGYEFPFSAELTWAKVKLGEKVMAAAVAAQAFDVKADLRKHTLFVEPVVINEISTRSVVIQFVMPVPSIEELTELCKIWEVDLAVGCKVNPVAKAKPCAHGYVLSIDKRALCVGYEIDAKVILSYQEAKDQDAQEEFDQMRCGELDGCVELIPQTSVRALQERMFTLRSNDCSKLATDEGKVGRIMSILLGRPVKPESPKANNPLMTFGALSKLKEGQVDTALCMLDEVPRLVFQQAGPGTGKTFSAASIVATVLATDPTARVLALAPPNVAVVKLVLEMQDALAAGKHVEPMLALFSGTGKLRYAKEVERISPHLLATAAEAQDFQELLQKDQERVKVERYLDACERNPRLAQEMAVAKIVQEHKNRRLCFATLSFCEQLPALFGETTHLIIDEAGQAPYVQILNLVSQLPCLTKVLITGDRRQLRVHLPSLPIAIREDFGMDTVIQNLDVAQGTDVTTLSVCFRSHSALVRCTEAGFYKPHGEQLTPGRDDSERALMINQTAFKLPKMGVPLILVHQNTPAQRDEVSTSSANPGQTDTAMRALWRLARAFPGTLIRCICFYAAQALEIERLVAQQEIPDILVTTADATQGHESSLAVIVTTCSVLDSGADSQPFWADAARVDVAISRASHGMIIIGDLLLLNRTETWRRYLDQATTDTTVVGPEYFDFEQFNNPDNYYDKDGQLISANGGAVRSEHFYSKYGKNVWYNNSGESRGAENRYQPYLPQGGTRERTRGKPSTSGARR